MAGAQSLGQIDGGLQGGVEVTSGGGHLAILTDDEGPVEGREFLQGFAQLRVEQVALLGGVTLEGVENSLARKLHYLVVIAQHEGGAHGLALAPLAGQFHRKIEQGLENRGGDVAGDVRKVRRNEQLSFLADVQHHDAIQGTEHR